MTTKAWLLGSLVVVACIWHSLARQNPKLYFAGFRHSPADGRWYADLWLTNTSSWKIRCSGYALENAAGRQITGSMLDFQCTVGFESKRVQSWPLWFATWLDLKPGEAAKLALNISPQDAPSKVGLQYSEMYDHPNKLQETVEEARDCIRSIFRIQNAGLQTVWCRTSPPMPPGGRIETNSTNKALQ